jgi:O-antigen ligase
MTPGPVTQVREPAPTPVASRNSESAAIGGPAISISRRRLGLAGIVVAAVVVGVSLSEIVGDVRVASISFSEIVAAVAGGASWTVLLLYGRAPRSAARAAVPFAAYVASMLISLVLGHGTRQGIQFMMVQVAFLGVLLVASTARRAVGDRLENVVGRCFRITAVVLGGATTLGAFGLGHAIGGTRPSAIVALVGLGWFLAEYKAGNRRALWWSLAIAAEIAISLSRTALLGAIVVMVAALLFGSRKHRARNAILCGLLVLTGAWAVTSWAPLHDRFVQGDVSLSVGGISVNAEGRTQVWQKLWSEIPGDLVFGRGPGTASARSVQILASFDHPHNDYLRILYDFGLLGTAVFAWFVIRCARLLRRAARGARGSMPARAAQYAGLAVLIMMATDNPLDYPFVMIPLGALIGVALGSTRSAPRRRVSPPAPRDGLADSRLPSSASRAGS